MSGPSEEPPRLDPLELQALQASVNAIDTKKQVKGKYAFWETQPVAQFREELSTRVRDVCPEILPRFESSI